MQFLGATNAACYFSAGLCLSLGGYLPPHIPLLGTEIGCLPVISVSGKTPLLKSFRNVFLGRALPDFSELHQEEWGTMPVSTCVCGNYFTILYHRSGSIAHLN